MVKHVERTFAGRPLKMETGRLAKQAAGACLIQFGETVVLATVTVSDQVSTLPFFPLTVEYREKAYAAGKIPGGFLKREGRPSDEEILSARVADRTFRPLFPEGFKNEVQIFVYVLSADQENDADVLGVTAASAALTMSKVPWNGPVAAVAAQEVPALKSVALDWHPCARAGETPNTVATPAAMARPRIDPPVRMLLASRLARPDGIRPACGSA